MSPPIIRRAGDYTGPERRRTTDRRRLHWVIGYGPVILLVLTAIIAVMAVGILFGLSRIQRNADRLKTQQRALLSQKEYNSNHRLLFKFSCSFSLAVAKSLDDLVVGALSDLRPGTSRQRGASLRKYHLQFQANKHICPPVSQAESQRILALLKQLGGETPRGP